MKIKEIIMWFAIIVLCAVGAYNLFLHVQNINVQTSSLQATQAVSERSLENSSKLEEINKALKTLNELIESQDEKLKGYGVAYKEIEDSLKTVLVNQAIDRMEIDTINQNLDYMDLTPLEEVEIPEKEETQ